jgi:hypothetical protein
MTVLARRLRDTNDAPAVSSFLSVRGRLARALLSLAEAFGRDVGSGGWPPGEQGQRSDAKPRPRIESTFRP